jgi:hypothetical protein
MKEQDVEECQERCGLSTKVRFTTWKKGAVIQNDTFDEGTGCRRMPRALRIEYEGAIYHEEKGSVIQIDTFDGGTGRRRMPRALRI